MKSNKLGIAVPALATGGRAAGAIAWRFAFFVAPLAWTGEASQLALELGVGPGVWRTSGPARPWRKRWRVACCRTCSRHRDLRRPGRRFLGEATGLANVTVVAAHADDTGLPDGACDALYLRHASTIC